MNILFLTITRFNDVEDKGIYTDLMRKFRDEGHNVYVVTPLERRYKQKTSLRENKGIHVLGVKTVNIIKANIFEKGLGILFIDFLFKSSIKKYLINIPFDFVIYSTPPITFSSAIKIIKKKYKSITYLLLKDIFPQNAVDIGLLSKKNPIYWYFKYKEKSLYSMSDYIGCMSPANVDFVLKNNKYLSPERVEVSPNSVYLSENDKDMDFDRFKIREEFSLPKDKLIFVYGGSLGKPQGIDYLINVLENNISRDDIYFLIVGSGSEYNKVIKWFNDNNPKNSKLISLLPENTYRKLLRSCDIGLIFLDYRFTIPNFPSRLLSYMEFKMPVLAATDINTDIGEIIENGGFGYWCESKNPENFSILIDKIFYKEQDIKLMGNKAYKYLLENYSIQKTYDAIVSHIK